MAEHPNVARIRDALAPRAEAVFGNIGMTGSGRSGGTTAPLRRMPLYAQAEKVLEDPQRGPHRDAARRSHRQRP
jgi:hypothetical protein